jgi:hypothetical protein
MGRRTLSCNLLPVTSQFQADATLLTNCPDHSLRQGGRGRFGKYSSRSRPGSDRLAVHRDEILSIIAEALDRIVLGDFGWVMTGYGDSIVRQALDNVRSQYAPDEWSILTPSQITKAIYGEIRRLDLDKLHKQVEDDLNTTD